MELRWVLATKLHGITVSHTNLYYAGSIGLPLTMIDAAGLRPNDVVEVYNFMSGARYQTYVMVGPDGRVEVNGPSARLTQPGDRLVVVQYVLTEDDVEPRILHYNAKNEGVAPRLTFPESHDVAPRPPGSETNRIIAIIDRGSDGELQLVPQVAGTEGAAVELLDVGHGIVLVACEVVSESDKEFLSSVLRELTATRQP